MSFRSSRSGCELISRKQPRSRCRRDQAIEIERIGVSLADQAPGRMPQNGQVAIVHGADDPLGLCGGGKIEIGMYRRHHDIEARQDRVRQVELAVGQDVDLDALQNRDPVELFVQPVDLGDLLRQPSGVEAVGDRHPAAVIRDGDVFIAACLGGGGHLGERSGAVAPGGVGMEVAAHVGKLDQARQPILPRQRDFTAIFPQLRRHICQSELSVDFLLGRPGDRLVAFEQPVFIELPAVLIGDPAQRDVVGLGSREIEQCRPVGLRRNDAKIDLQSRTQDHRGPGRTVGGDLRHVFVSRQFVADLGAVASRHQDIEIADRIAPPPVAACDHDLALADPLAQRMGKGLRLGFRNREPEALFRGRLCQGREHLFLDGGAEPARFVQAAGLGGAAKILDGTDAELVDQQLDALWSEPRQGGDLADVRLEARA